MEIANGNLTVAMGIIVTINILAVLFSGTIGVPTIGDFVVYQVVSEEQFEDGRVEQVNPSFDEGFNKDVTQETSAGGLFSLIDGLKKIFAVLITILTLGFAIAGMLYAMNAPLAIVVLVGVPIGISFYMSILGAVRGKDI